jgi:hypothetical protein
MQKAAAGRPRARLPVPRRPRAPQLLGRRTGHRRPVPGHRRQRAPTPAHRPRRVPIRGRPPRGLTPGLRAAERMADHLARPARTGAPAGPLVQPIGRHAEGVDPSAPAHAPGGHRPAVVGPGPAFPGHVPAPHALPGGRRRGGGAVGLLFVRAAGHPDPPSAARAAVPPERPRAQNRHEL